MGITAGVRKKEGSYLGKDSLGNDIYSDDYYSNGKARDYAAEYLMANNPKTGDTISSLPESEWYGATKAYTDTLINEFNNQYPGAKKSGSNKSGTAGSYGSLASQLADARKAYFGMNYDDWSKGDSYDSLKKKYQESGRVAMDDTLGKAAARTGGLASSYATTAANQVYSDYMSAFGDAARSQYESEKAEKLNELNELESIYGTEYSRRQAEQQTAYERSLAAKQAAQNDALLRAQYGDYSGLINLGIDTAAYEDQQKRTAALEEAYAAAQYGDYSYLKNLGIDTTAYESQQQRAAALDEAITAAKYGDYSYLRKLGIDTTLIEKEVNPEKVPESDDPVIIAAKEAYPDGVLPDFYYDELISRGYTDTQLSDYGLTREQATAAVPTTESEFKAMAGENGYADVSVLSENDFYAVKLGTDPSTMKNLDERTYRQAKVANQFATYEDFLAALWKNYQK